MINPALICSNMPDDAEYEEYMKVCICLLSLCDAIYMPKGWEKSGWARLEYAWMKTKGKLESKEYIFMEE